MKVCQATKRYETNEECMNGVNNWLDTLVVPFFFYEGLQAVAQVLEFGWRLNEKVMQLCVYILCTTNYYYYCYYYLISQSEIAFGVALVFQKTGSLKQSYCGVHEISSRAARFPSQM